jgi:hypothetical protein
MANYVQLCSTRGECGNNPGLLMFMDTPQPIQLHDKAGPSQFPQVLPQVFTETPISQPTPLSLLTTSTPAIDTLASGAGHLPSPWYFPPRKKLVKKVALHENSDLSIFDILSLFHHCWFLSVDSLRAQALLAQKAEDGNIIWVKFTPQFHSHLVKSAVALAPWPIQKVKKVLFVYTLELLNGVSPQAFFNLTKGDQWATTA